MTQDARKNFLSLRPQDLFSGYMPLPDYSAFWQSLEKQLDRINRRSTHGTGFQGRKNSILQAAPDVKGIISVMQGAAYIRPLIDLWRGDAFEERIPWSGELLLHLETLANKSRRGRMGRLALRELCHVFFLHYNHIPCLEALCQTLHYQFTQYKIEDLRFGLEKSLHDRKHLFSTSGHEHLINSAVANRTSLNIEADRYGIPTDSRFMEVAQHEYYIAHLRKLKPNEDSNILLQIQNKDVHELKVSLRERLGHKVLTILIDKLRESKQSPSELWRTTLLVIAGDPRLPKRSPSYALWWNALDASYAETMREWLSEVDMELFLHFLKEFAQQEGGDILRMYPEREYFLRGIFKKKLVRGTRLFIGKELQSYVNNSCKGKYRPYYINLVGSGSNNLAVFYLNMGINAHIVEGTHNFMLRIFACLPESSPLRASIGQATRTEVGPGLKNQYIDAYKTDEGYCEIRHIGNWKERAVKYLRETLNVPILLSDVQRSFL